MVSNIKDSKAIISSSIIIGLSIGIWRTKELIKTHLFFDFLFAFYLELSKAIFGILLEVWHHFSGYAHRYFSSRSCLSTGKADAGY